MKYRHLPNEQSIFHTTPHSTSFVTEEEYALEPLQVRDTRVPVPYSYSYDSGAAEPEK